LLVTLSALTVTDVFNSNKCFAVFDADGAGNRKASK
jgi:hypothetical protein